MMNRMSIRKILLLVLLVSAVAIFVNMFVTSGRKQLLRYVNVGFVADTMGLRRPLWNHTAVSSTEAADRVASELYKRVRILCWVMTAPKNLESRVKYVIKTWGRRCNKLVIVSSEANEKYGVVAIDVKEGRNHLTRKTLGGFHYVYKHHLNDADWFLKADDDTYVILENLRYMLSEEDTSEPVYFGHHFKSIGTYPYSSGGSGFVVSKEALRRFGRAPSLSRLCRQTGTAGDEAFGHCMGSLGVKLKNSTDKYGGTRFHCLSPEDWVSGTFPEWLYVYDANGIRKGVDGLSDYVISFHYVAGPKMETLDYLIYHARPYGIKNTPQDINQRQPRNTT